MLCCCGWSGVVCWVLGGCCYECGIWWILVGLFVDWWFVIDWIGDDFVVIDFCCGVWFFVGYFVGGGVDLW